RFTPGDFAVLAHTPHIHLRVQPRTWLRRQQMERITLRLAAAEPFCRFQPHWMTRAILVTEPGDRLGEDLDAARGRDEGMSERITAKILEQHERLCGLGHLKESLRPEFVKVWPYQLPAGRLLPCRLVQMTYEFHLRASFSKCGAHAKALRQIREDH